MTPFDTPAGHFAVLAALVVPSEAAAPMSSLEWRALRVAWLDALAALGLSEEDARWRASTYRHDAIRSLAATPTLTPAKEVRA